jgi:hypothetical protein
MSAPSNGQRAVKGVINAAKLPDEHGEMPPFEMATDNAHVRDSCADLH